MIQINNLSKSFNKKVLENVNFSIDDGSIFGLIGVNGAGKSTLLNILSGVMKPNDGEVLYDGINVYENEKVKGEIFYLPDEPYFGRNATPKSLADSYNVFYDVSYIDYLGYLEKFKIQSNGHIEFFSKGMKRQVFVALALSIKPKYLFLDEAFDGLDPLARLEVKKALLKVQEENGMTVVISSHSLRELEDICDSYGIIDSTKIKSYGDVTDASEKYHKYTLVFNNEYDAKDFSGVNFVSFKKEGKVINCVTLLEKEELEEMIKDKSPLLVEEHSVNFEEVFMIEVAKENE